MLSNLLDRLGTEPGPAVQSLLQSLDGDLELSRHCGNATEFGAEIFEVFVERSPLACPRCGTHLGESVTSHASRTQRFGRRFRSQEAATAGSGDISSRPIPREFVEVFRGARHRRPQNRARHIVNELRVCRLATERNESQGGETLARRATETELGEAVLSSYWAKERIVSRARVINGFACPGMGTTEFATGGYRKTLRGTFHAFSYRSGKLVIVRSALTAAMIAGDVIAPISDQSVEPPTLRRSFPVVGAIFSGGLYA